MAENSRPPVAIRIVRPYDTEDEFLEAELETVGKTSVILIGAHPRPTGVILRFEVTLGNGATVLRGEGRVLAHKENAFRGQPGLSLRFTRLDPRSKALVDRAATLREAKAAGGGPRSSPPDSLRGPNSGRVAPVIASVMPEVAPARQSSSTNVGLGPKLERAREDAAITDALTASTPEPALTHRSSRPPMPIAPIASSSMPPVPPPPSTPLPSVEVEVEVDQAIDEAPTHVETRSAPPPPPPPPRTSAAGTLEPPPNRAELLSRLRERASKLPPDAIEAILRSQS